MRPITGVNVRSMDARLTGALIGARHKKYLVIAFLIGLSIVSIWTMELLMTSEQSSDMLAALPPHDIIDRPQKKYKGENNTGILSKKDPSFFQSFQEEIDSLDDEARCSRYGFNLTSDDPVHRRTEPRRVFFGSLIASESWELFEIAAAETFGMYEGIVLVESNRTQNFTPRNLTHYNYKEKHEEIIGRMFGIPNDKVQIRSFVNEDPKLMYLSREHAQRNDILNGWKELGMQPDDVAILSDMDEVLTRDFLRAIQICDVIDGLDYHSHECQPQRMGLRTSTQVYEGSPECITHKRSWSQPSFFVGHCIEGISDKTAIHKPPPRQKNGKRLPGWGQHDWNKTNPYHPLSDGGDFRNVGASRIIKVQDEALAPETTKRHYSKHTAFHLHNFFADDSILRFKYKTYGHAMSDADSKPLEEICKDLALMVYCAQNEPDPADASYKRVIGGFESLDPFTPIYFKDADYRRRRHHLVRDIIVQNHTEK